MVVKMLVRAQAREWQYEELANAIIVQAAKDYLKCLEYLNQGIVPHIEKEHKRHIKAIKDKSDCECFFVSDWFIILTELSGETIMEKICLQAA